MDLKINISLLLLDSEEEWDPDGSCDEGYYIRVINTADEVHKKYGWCFKVLQEVHFVFFMNKSIHTDVWIALMYINR